MIFMVNKKVRELVDLKHIEIQVKIQDKRKLIKKVENHFFQLKQVKKMNNHLVHIIKKMVEIKIVNWM